MHIKNPFTNRLVEIGKQTALKLWLEHKNGTRPLDKHPDVLQALRAYYAPSKEKQQKQDINVNVNLNTIDDKFDDHVKGIISKQLLRTSINAGVADAFTENVRTYRQRYAFIVKHFATSTTLATVANNKNATLRTILFDRAGDYMQEVAPLDRIYGSLSATYDSPQKAASITKLLKQLDIPAVIKLQLLASIASYGFKGFKTNDYTIYPTWGGWDGFVKHYAIMYPHNPPLPNTLTPQSTIKDLFIALDTIPVIDMYRIAWIEPRRKYLRTL